MQGLPIWSSAGTNLRQLIVCIIVSAMNESGISLSGEYNRIVEQVRSKQEHHKRRQQPRRQEASIELQQQPQQQTPQQMQ